MKKYLIIADDFTGANDTGVQLTKKSIPTKVKFSDSLEDKVESLVIDTETRNLSSEETKRKLIKILSPVNLDSYDYVIKKVDSTLRGNIVEELQIIDNLYTPDLIIFDNALPSLNRIIKNGILYVNGVRGIKTDFSKDPIKPLKEDNILRILDRAFPNENKRLFSLEDLRKNNFEIENDCRLYACDSINDQDMQVLVHKFLKKVHDKRILWIGSSGIMEAILNEIYPANPSLGLVGSVSQVTRKQIEYAAQNNVTVVAVPISQVYKNENYSEYVDLAIQSLRNRRDTIIASSASCDIQELDNTRQSLVNEGLSMDEINSVVQSVLGGICRKVIEKQTINGLFITGGDTAKGFFDGIRANSVSIKEEIAIGVPLMRVNGGIFDSLNIVTKAGAFGYDDLITYSFKKLKENSFKTDFPQEYAV
ncbi:uncharacterized protein JG29_01080 [Bombilactobacillus mellis]|uniref:Four-carbon acid sugar kinase family protein n=1 Tax=Bombilactobacillus mellis TaxID=1218508 RepID=A0A0F4KXD4_9LACO|nr:four-carbon acid sugar kinase family protein [Bombilactobacillus mellis]KJY51065.1 uncharacterized protein JG29_01080 [Bombilactobacillus mellis]